MSFPVGTWCPSLGKKGKGKEVGHQGNRLYSYSTYVPYITYVLKSMHKGEVPFFGCRYALSCREGSFSETGATYFFYLLL